ncbi:MAG: LPXTG cell wall anchor domain-containing protein [Actinobacteria bacterium]|nr:LPXTG cell wall anchor domain-containing protein [Actinomycetota bacterium]
MIRKIAVVAAAMSLFLTGAAEAGANDPLYPPQPDVTVVKVVKTVEKVNKVNKVPARQGQLPKTGAESLPLTQIGAGLLAVGAVLVLLERNRRAAQSQHVDIS